MPLYLGLDSSTQSLSAIVLDIDANGRRVVFEESLAFDETFPEYGTSHGVLPGADPAVAVSSPLMWAAALDRMMARLAASIELPRLAAAAWQRVPERGRGGGAGRARSRPAAGGAGAADAVARRLANLDGLEHGRGVPRHCRGGRR